MSKRSKKKRERKRRQKATTRLNYSLSDLHVAIRGNYFACRKKNNMRPVGICVKCSKKCKDKKLMIEFWKRWFAEHGDATSIPPTRVIENSNLKYSRKNKKWYREVKYRDGASVLYPTEADDENLNPDDFADDKSTEITTHEVRNGREPMVLILKDKEE